MKIELIFMPKIYVVVCKSNNYRKLGGNRSEDRKLISKVNKLKKKREYNIHETNKADKV